MHRPASSRRQRWTLSRLRLSHSGTTLEDRLPAYGHATSRTLSRLRRSHRRCRPNLLRRRRVHRTRSGLRCNHAPHRSRRRLRALLLLRGVCDRSGWRRRRSRGRCDLHCRRSLRRLCYCCRWLSRDRRLGSRDRRARCRSSGLLGRRRCSRRRSGKGWALSKHRFDYPLCRSFRSSCGRRSRYRLVSRRRRWGSRFRRSCRRRSNRLGRRRRGGFGLLLQKKTGNIPGLGDVREIDLGFDLRFTRARAAIACGRSGATWSREVFAHTLGLVGLNRARVRLLFRYSDYGKDVENRLALDFQFPCQIVDSNFTHSALCVSPKPCF
jgi:hypothetical protein